MLALDRYCICHRHQAFPAWASAGECKRGHLTPGPLAGQNSMFLGVYEANSMFLPPGPGLPGKFCPPLEKKSKDAHDFLISSNAYDIYMFGL